MNAKLAQVINKATGGVLAEFLTMTPAEFSVEFGEGFTRLFVVRDVASGKITDSVEIGDADIKMRIIKKNIMLLPN